MGPPPINAKGHPGTKTSVVRRNMEQGNHLIFSTDEEKSGWR